MLMNEQVLTALEVLRNFAENDFERHRIDVLEKDLTEPPKVEIVGDNCQIFNNVKYYQHKKEHYRAAQNLHKVVYRYYFGDTPEGYEIHHKDLNKSNNDISNLQCLTSMQHHQIHAALQRKKKEKKSRELKSGIRDCPICGNAFYYDSGKHVLTCSKECAKKLNVKTRLEKRKKICPVCGKEFIPLHKTIKTCSPHCGRILRYSN